MVWYLWHFLLGYLVVDIRGQYLERFINLAVVNNISLWDIQEKQGGIRAAISIRDFFRIRPVAKKSASRVRIVSKKGLPFYLNRLKRRFILPIGALVFLIIIYMLSSFIWFVEVRGLEEMDEVVLLEQLGHLGLKPGVWKGSLDKDDVAHRLTVRLPEIAWTGITIYGTKAVVDVVENTLPPEDMETAPGNIVATRAGIVEDVLVLSGVAMVTEGQTVKEGDLLISGTISSESDELLRSKGRIMARTWYEAYYEVAIYQSIVYRTGQVVELKYVQVFDRLISLTPYRKIPFSKYQREEIRSEIPFWRNLNFPVEVITLRYYETGIIVNKISTTAARDKAENEAKAAILNEIPLHAKIVDVNATIIQNTNQVVGIRVVVEVIQDIGEFQAFEVE